MMNLHVTPDDKFLDNFIDMYGDSHVLDDNVFVTALASPSNGLKYIRNTRVKVFDLNSAEWKAFLGDLGKFSVIYFHSIGSIAHQIIPQVSDKTKIYWIFWGYEYYCAPFTQHIWEKETIDAFWDVYKCKRGIFWKLIPDGILTALKKLRERKWKKLNFSIYHRIDSFLHWNKLDYDIIKEAVPSFGAQFVEFCYCGLLSFNIGKSTSDDRVNILLGNSALHRDNHLSILRKLSQRKDKDKLRIITPLSYGDSGYADLVQEMGERLFGANFSALRSFLPRDEYFEIFRSIDCVVMNHIRTAGAGNVYAALKAGNKVFMHPDNTQYQMLLDLGVQVESNDRILDEDAFNPLSVEEKMINQTKLEILFKHLRQQYDLLP